MSELGFTIEIHQNEYLPDRGREVNAIITVTSHLPAVPAELSAPPTPVAPVPLTVPLAKCAQIIIVDCSGSMNIEATKMSAVLRAANAAVNMVPDGVEFALIAGNTRARPLYPDDGTLAVASPKTRVAAKKAVTHLKASGGTAIGQWLRLAGYIFAATSAELRHAILLTDGKNEHEAPAELDAALGLCTGAFTCDCRGIGADWEVAELRRIATALLGTVDIVPDPRDLEADFVAMMETAVRKQVADVALRIWTPDRTDIRFVRKVAPFIDDLTGRRTESGRRTGDYPIGAWGVGESRDYHLRVRVSPGAVGQEMLAARVRLTFSSAGERREVGEGLVRAVWTADKDLFAAVNRQVAHYSSQAELAHAIDEGLAARRQGDEVASMAKLGRAVAIAEQSGNEDTARLLARVVDVLDAPAGTVRLKKTVEWIDEMTLDTRSTKTVRIRK